MVLACSTLLLAACREEKIVEQGADAGIVELSLTIENLAEDDALVSADSEQHPVAFAPAIVVLHAPSTAALFQVGEPASAELEELAEEGNPGPLVQLLDARPDLEAQAVTRIDMTTYKEAPLEPGTMVTVDFSVAQDAHLSIASMFGQSNDIFVAARDVAPFSSGEFAGDLTSLFAYYDAGTEKNQEPGTGSHQAPRQSEPGAGDEENGVVTRLEGDVDAEGYSYPPIAEVLRVTLARSE